MRAGTGACPYIGLIGPIGPIKKGEGNRLPPSGFTLKGETALHHAAHSTHAAHAAHTARRHTRHVTAA